MQRAGRLPMAEPGRRAAQALVADLVPMLARWQALQAQLPEPPARPAAALRSTAALVLDDWLGGLRAAAGGSGTRTRSGWNWCPAGCAPTRRGKTAARRPTARRLGAHAGGQRLRRRRCGGVIVGRDACVTVQPWPRAPRAAALAELMQAWHEGLHGSAAPLPLAPRTALALVQGARRRGRRLRRQRLRPRPARRRRGGLPGAPVPRLRGAASPTGVSSAGRSVCSARWRRGSRDARAAGPARCRRGPRAARTRAHD